MFQPSSQINSANQIFIKLKCYEGNGILICCWCWIVVKIYFYFRTYIMVGLFLNWSSLLDYDCFVCFLPVKVSPFVILHKICIVAGQILQVTHTQITFIFFIIFFLTWYKDASSGTIILHQTKMAANFHRWPWYWKAPTYIMYLLF